MSLSCEVVARAANAEVLHAARGDEKTQLQDRERRRGRIERERTREQRQPPEEGLIERTRGQRQTSESCRSMTTSGTLSSLAVPTCHHCARQDLAQATAQSATQRNTTRAPCNREAIHREHEGAVEGHTRPESQRGVGKGKRGQERAACVRVRGFQRRHRRRGFDRPRQASPFD